MTATLTRPLTLAARGLAITGIAATIAGGIIAGALFLRLFTSYQTLRKHARTAHG